MRGGSTSVRTSYAHRHPSTYEIIQNFNMRSCRDFMDLGLLRSGSVHDFKTVLLFFLATFGTKFDALLFTHIETNLDLGIPVPKGLRQVADVCPAPQSGMSRKKIVCIEKVYKINHAETNLSISSVSFIIHFTKAGAVFFMH